MASKVPADYDPNVHAEEIEPDCLQLGQKTGLIYPHASGDYAIVKFGKNFQDTAIVLPHLMYVKKKALNRQQLLEGTILMADPRFHFDAYKYLPVCILLNEM